MVTDPYFSPAIKLSARVVKWKSEMAKHKSSNKTMANKKTKNDQ